MRSSLFFGIASVLLLSASSALGDGPDSRTDHLRENIERVEETEAGIKYFEKPKILHRPTINSKYREGGATNEHAPQNNEHQFEWIDRARMGSDTARYYGQLLARKGSSKKASETSTFNQKPQGFLRK